MLLMGKLKQNALKLLCLLTCATLFAAGGPDVPYEGLKVKKIVVTFQHQAPGDRDDTEVVIQKLGVKKGEPFNQETFDQDLKQLSEDYDWIEPSLSVDNKELTIHLEIKKRPVITRFHVQGSNYKPAKVLREGQLKTGMTYNRDNFYKSINKIRDFFIKKGFFKVEVDYEIEPYPSDGEVLVTIIVHPGPKGRINDIVYEGFSPKEIAAIKEIIRTQKYNMFTSWLTGSGTIKEEDFDPDVQVIVHYLQNQGYVNAHVKMRLQERPDNKMALVIHADRGAKYHINNVTYSGYTLKTTEEVEKATGLKQGDVYSIDAVRAAQERLKELYTKDGYLQTNIDFTQNAIPGSHEYNLHFNIEESEQNRVGLVVVSGNLRTRKNVIYNNLDFEPGEVFDSRKLKTSQRKLMSTGYFKNVNIYPVRADDPELGSTEYRDIVVEVDEAQTGNASLFMGFSSTDNIFGGLDFTENNFNIEGLRSVWSDGPRALRGGGEFLQLKGTVGAREYGANVSWLNPYLFDSLWRFGMNLDYNKSSIVSKNYDIHTFGGSMTATYPLTSNFSYGFRYRIKDSLFRASADSPPLAIKERLNGGLVSGIASTFGYDSTDNPFKPHRGVRSNWEGEFAGLVRNVNELHDFPFLRFQSFNSFYYPVWRKGTFKLRGDFKFIQPLWGGVAGDFPMGERFFLGGEATVRGYAPGKIGPTFGQNEPTGGVTSALFSAEYSQNIFKPIDIFTFFDAGSIELQPWRVGKIKMSTGAGLRLDIGRQLPFMIGYGYPINPDFDGQKQGIFFSMAGQF